MVIGFFVGQVMLGLALGGILFVAGAPLRVFFAWQRALQEVMSLWLVRSRQTHFDNSPGVIFGDDERDKKFKVDGDNVRCNWLPAPGLNRDRKRIIAFLPELVADDTSSHSLTILVDGWSPGVSGDPQVVNQLRLGLNKGLVRLASSWGSGFGWTQHMHRLPSNTVPIMKATEELSDSNDNSSALRNLYDVIDRDGRMSTGRWSAITVTGPRPKSLSKRTSDQITPESVLDVPVVQAANEVIRLLESLRFTNPHVAKPTSFMALMRAAMDPANAAAVYLDQHNDVVRGARGEYRTIEDTILGRYPTGVFPSDWRPILGGMWIGDTLHRYYLAELPVNRLRPDSNEVEFDIFDGIMTARADLFFGIASINQLTKTKGAALVNTLWRRGEDVHAMYIAGMGQSQSVKSQWRRARQTQEEVDLLSSAGLGILDAYIVDLMALNEAEMEQREKQLRENFRNNGNVSLYHFKPASYQFRLACAMYGISTTVM